MTTTQTILGNFIVKRGPELDSEYMAQIIARERAVALREVVSQVIAVTKQQSGALMRLMGLGALRTLQVLDTATK